jgi:hypothetical protein
MALDEPPAGSAAPDAAPNAAAPPGEFPAHRQPTPQSLRQREAESHDVPSARRQKAEQEEIDRLFQEIMRRSAPPQPGR